MVILLPPGTNRARSRPHPGTNAAQASRQSLGRGCQNQSIRCARWSFSKSNTAPASDLKTIHQFLLLGVVSQSRQRRLFWCDCLVGGFSGVIVLMDGPLVLAIRGALEAGVYRGTSLTQTRTPLGHYRRPMPRVLGGS